MRHPLGLLPRVQAQVALAGKIPRRPRHRRRCCCCHRCDTKRNSELVPSACTNFRRSYSSRTYLFDHAEGEIDI